MTTTVRLYDEPGSRTRYSWIRTALGVVVVTALVEHGLVQRGISAEYVVGAALPALAFLALTLARINALDHQRAPEITHKVIVASTAITLVIAAVGVGSLLIAHAWR